MAMRGIDDDQVDAGVDQALGALDAVIADADGGGDAQAALRILGGIRVELRLFDVLDGDQADATADPSSTTSSFSMRCVCRRRLASF